MSTQRRILLGISAYYHDSAAALIRDGIVVAAAQEERFTRLKHDPSFPSEAIRFCLRQAKVTLEELDAVVFYDKPFVKFERLMETYLAFAPRGFRSFATSMPLWLKEKLFQRETLCRELKRIDPKFNAAEKLLFSEHHLSHAASAYYPSPFEEAVVLTLDGVGEWATSSVCIGRGRALRPEKEIRFPHSLGLLYSAFTAFCGFRVNSGEYKLMGLAPYGHPRFLSRILENLIEVKPDGSFRLNMEYFDYGAGTQMTSMRFASLFGGSARLPDEPLTTFHMDLAASIQAALDEILLKMTDALAHEFSIPNLCLAGGVALNCVANGKILRKKSFQHLWIQPAAGDAGSALGAALLAHHMHFGSERAVDPTGADSFLGGFLGPEYSAEEIQTELNRVGAVYERIDDPAQLVARCASALANGRAIAWFQGRMEFGPRALGARSILADPRSEQMQSTLNLKIKFRESFRPFAPAVLSEDAAEWFELDRPSPYMMLVAPVHAHRLHALTSEERSLEGLDQLRIPRSSIPAVTHVDGSARVQTVHHESQPLFHALLSEFKRHTDCPVMANTSFNVRGEPIVASPADAWRCFMGTGIDGMAIGPFYLEKSLQKVKSSAPYPSQFAPD